MLKNLHDVAKFAEEKTTELIKQQTRIRFYNMLTTIGLAHPPPELQPYIVQEKLTRYMINDNDFMFSGRSRLELTLTELPILAVPKIMSILSHSSVINPKELAANYRVTETNLLANTILTKHLNEVLFLLVHGKSIKAVAHALNISPKTVEEHINRLKEIFSCYTKSIRL